MINNYLLVRHVLTAVTDSIHPLWKEVHSLDGKLIYFNPHTGRYDSFFYQIYSG